MDEFQKGNTAFRSGSYESSIEHYENVVQKGLESPELYYNLGNAYYKSGKMGFAILNYERASRLSPGDEDIAHNLLFVNSKIIDKIEPVPSFFIYKWWDNILMFFSLNGWLYLGYIIYLSLLVMFAGFVVRRSWRRKLLYPIAICSVLLISIIFVFIFKLDREHYSKNGVITDNIVTVKVSPDESSSAAFVIHEGLKVQIQDKVDYWFKIRLNDGKLGWINQSDLKII